MCGGVLLDSAVTAAHPILRGQRQQTRVMCMRTWGKGEGRVASGPSLAHGGAGGQSGTSRQGEQLDLGTELGWVWTSPSK